MWYEVLPSLAIIGVCMTMPQILVYLSHQLVLGTPYKRALKTRNDKFHMLRDARISGVDSPYKQVGIRDFHVSEKKKKKKKEEV